MSFELIALRVLTMRVVEYNGLPVKRQKKVGPNEIKVVFYDDNPPIFVTVKDWNKNSRNRYFDDPSIKRRDVVHKHAVAY